MELRYNFHFETVWRELDRLLWASLTTIELSVVSFFFGTILSILFALCLRTNKNIFNLIIFLYIEIIRNTPFLAQIFLLYFGFASIGIRFDANFAAVLSLSIYFAGYGTEIIRAGIDSIDKHQYEAGLSLGMTKYSIFFKILLFQGIRNIYPALSSQFILLLLTTSVASVISVEELTGEANLFQSETFRSFEIYFVVAGFYLILSSLFKIILKLFWFFYFTKQGKIK